MAIGDPEYFEEADYDDEEPAQDLEDDNTPEGFCAFGCGKELCQECMSCHDCDKGIIETGCYECYPCYPNHPGVPLELRLPEGL